MTHNHSSPDELPSASTCEDSVRWVSQLRDGELSAADQQSLDEHLKICVRCQVARRQFNMLFAELDVALARHPQQSK